MKYYEAFNGDATDDFWELFPVFKAHPFFKDIFKKDRSTNKNKSIKLMWGLTLLLDLDSELYNAPEDEAYENAVSIVDMDLIKYVGSSEEWNVTKKAFIDFIDTKLSRSLRDIESKLVERDKFIRDTPYSLDSWDVPEGSTKPILVKGTAKDLDVMITSTDKIYGKIRELRAELQNQSASNSFGGAVPSLGDSGMV